MQLSGEHFSNLHILKKEPNKPRAEEQTLRKEICLIAMNQRTNEP